MQIPQLDEFFEITQYQLCGQSAIVELIDGNIVVQAQYRFRNAADRQAGPVILVEMIMTQQQSDDLKAILAAVLQATNAAIETETGWILYEEEEVET